MSSKRKFKRHRMKMESDENESQLANATINNYQMMLDYCRHIHSAFASMIDVADNDDTVDADPTLRQWTEEQIEILEKIFEYDDAREELLNAVVKESVARISLSDNKKLN